MVCHGKKAAGGCATGVLVVEPRRFGNPPVLWLVLPQRFRGHLRLRLHLDSLHPESHHPPTEQGGTIGLRGLRKKGSAIFEFLSELRCAAGNDYGLGAELVAAGRVTGIPHFFKMGWKSGWAWP